MGERMTKQACYVSPEYVNKLTGRIRELEGIIKKANNEFGSETLNGPPLWESIAKIKQQTGEQYRRIRKLENKLNKNSQNFQIECQLEEIKLLRSQLKAVKPLIDQFLVTKPSADQMFIWQQNFRAAIGESE
jgi:hypothetical protein